MSDTHEDPSHNPPEISHWALKGMPKMMGILLTIRPNLVVVRAYDIALGLPQCELGEGVT
jgi:hypothetical protein